MVIENVPGLVTLAGGAYLRAILQGLQDEGYEAACAELLAAQYGVPQMRWRLIIVAWRRDLGIPTGYGFPRPSHGREAIGDLLPNCTITAQQMQGFITTGDAISDLPAVCAGEEVTEYVGPPASAYQAGMRDGCEMSCTTITLPGCPQPIWPVLPFSALARTGAICRGISCPEACSVPCARITPAGTGA